MDDRLRVEHRCLETVERRDIGHRCALAHNQPDPHRAERRTRVAAQDAVLHPRIDRRQRHQHHVGLLAGGKLLLHGGDHDVGEMQLVAGPLLELRRQHAKHFLRRAAGHHVNVRSQRDAP